MWGTVSTSTFPAATEEQKVRIRNLGEELDRHRKVRLAAYDGLTMTEMYNVLAKLRADEALTVREETVHQQGVVSVLRSLHDELDAVVAEAYGWPADLPDEDLLYRLVELNRIRTEEER